jgi:tRNA (guanine-N7-)-methyltransferase
LQVEIGFGNGEHLVRRAGREPGLNLLGIDVSWPSVRRALRKIALAEVENVRVIQAGATPALGRLFSAGAISGVEALFPRPWPSRRHRKYRLFSQDFQRLLNNRLCPGGKVRMVTDHQQYAAWSLGQSRGAKFSASLVRKGPGLDTKYERKWLGQGQEEFYELLLIKAGHVEMPANREAAVQVYRLGYFQPRAFPLGPHQGEITVIFKDKLHDPEQERTLVRALVSEEDVTQSVWLEFRREQGQWELRLAPGCGAIPTLGLQHTIRLARDLATNNVKQ